VSFVVQIDLYLGVDVNSILHFRKELHDPPAVVSVGGTCVRTITIPDDLAAWLVMRDRAVAELIPAVRPWTPADFFTEMVEKPWWRGDGSWVAVTAGEREELIGGVTLAVREGSAGSVPVVHWLLVDPAWRRRGIGRLLMFHLERAAWDAGWREVQLETHTGWAAAIAFYQSIGYGSLLAEPPR
jgi:GNAT superfamily N-acetyltransferase